MSRDFVDGRFFHYELLVDDRFREIAVLVGRMTSEQIEMNSFALRQLYSPLSDTIVRVNLDDTALIRSTASAMTIWTLVIEGAVALCFLAPRRLWLPRVRDFALLIFVVTTYFAANVIGFGWLLIIMGFSQSDDRPHRNWLPLAYLGAFQLLEIYHVPWYGLLFG